MGGFKTPVKGPRGDGDGASDSVSELSIVASSQSQHFVTSKISKARPLRPLWTSARIVGGMKRLSSSGSKTVDSANDDAPPSSPDGVEALDLSVESLVTKSRDGESHARQSLMKTAKTRFNMGVVFLKTGNYNEAINNLEQSLYAHIQLSGHDAKSYTPDTLLAVADIHEKIGDCFANNSDVSDDYLALDHYQESRKMLQRMVQCIEPGNAHDAEQMEEMLERVNEKLKLPVLVQEESSKIPTMKANKYETKANAKAASLRFCTLVNSVRILTPPSHFEKSNQGTHEFVNEIKGRRLERSFDQGSLSDADAQRFARAMAYLERNEHQVAFNYLKSMQEEEHMENPEFRAKMESNMLMVASNALEAGRTTVAADAYDELLNLLEQNHRTRLNSMLIRRGCIEAHKAMALEMESVMDYETAIQQRIRVKELLDEDNKFNQACKELLKIANLQGEKNHDYDQCILTLADIERRLLERSPSLDLMPLEHTNLLIQCYHTGAISFSKASKWKEAVQQYNALIPLLAKAKGQDCQEYNSASIQKAALLVKIGDYDHALSIIIDYFDLADKSAEKLFAEESDHVLAMDVYVSLLLYSGNVDKAKDLLEKKLAFLDRLPNNDEMKSDTMHKVGCLLVFKNEHELAMPLLNEALDCRKHLYDGRHKAVFESMWAVATTAQSLGDVEKSLDAYSELVSMTDITEELPVDIIRIFNLAGKLFFDDGNTGKSFALFRQALREAESRHDDEQKHVAELNLANVLSVLGRTKEAMDLYDRIECTKTIKLSKIFFMALVNKCALLIKMGEVEEADRILCKIEDTHSANADYVRGRVYLLQGFAALLKGKVIEARSFFEDSLDVADDDLNSIVLAKKCISHAYLASRQYAKAIFILDVLLRDLSGQSAQSKSMNVTKAEIRNLMAMVYRRDGNLSQAINFAKLALQTYRIVLGEAHPTTLRNVSNLQVLLLEEAEGLDKTEAMFVTDVAKFELEDTLDAFESMNDPLTYRFEIVSLRINLGFIAVWQGKPKKARMYLRQTKDVKNSSDQLLLHRVLNLEESIVQLEEKRLSRTCNVSRTAPDHRAPDGAITIVRITALYILIVTSALFMQLFPPRYIISPNANYSSHWHSVHDILQQSS